MLKPKIAVSDVVPQVDAGSGEKVFEKGQVVFMEKLADFFAGQDILDVHFPDLPVPAGCHGVDACPFGKITKYALEFQR